MGKIERIQLAPGNRERLERLVRNRNTPQKVVWRARIVLLAGNGIGAVAVARQVGKSVPTIRRWRRRYVAAGVDGLLKDATRPPGRKPLPVETIRRVVAPTLHQTPPAATHWSERTMAAKLDCAFDGAQDLEGARAEAALGRDLQAVAGSGLRRQGGGRRRPLPRPAGQGAGAVGRREEPDPS